jgi:hypothetical protein
MNLMRFLRASNAFPDPWLRTAFGILPLGLTFPTLITSVFFKKE